MKTLITTLGLAAALSVSLVSTSAISGPTIDGWVGCNTEYTACLSGGTDMSLATNVNDAVAQGSANTSNWVSCNGALAACYQSLN